MKLFNYAIAGILATGLIVVPSLAQDDKPATPVQESTEAPVPDDADPTQSAETDNAAPVEVESAEVVEGENAEVAIPAALDFQMKNIDGEEVSLGKYAGKVIVVVNVASRCGLTPQYEQLQQLHDMYAEKGVAVIGFPCNQFNGQEPGSEAEIKDFCSREFGVTFDMFSKVNVNGADRCEFYNLLCEQNLAPAGTGDISWNFEKFLIDKSGMPIARFGPRTKPDDADFVAAIDAALSTPAPESNPAEMAEENPEVKMLTIVLPAMTSPELSSSVMQAMTELNGVTEVIIDEGEKTCEFTVPPGLDVDAVLNGLVEDGNEGLKGWTRK